MSTLEMILKGMGAFYAFATVIANLTPTNKDNGWLNAIGRLADRFGLQLKTPED